MQMPPLPLGAALTIEVAPYMLPGVLMVLGNHIYTRHMSELLVAMSGATWHPNSGACPTWTDDGECRCMVDP